MFRRSVLLNFLVLTVSLPVIAFAGTDDVRSTPDSSVSSESLCNRETLGTAENGGTVAFAPMWEPAKYSCGAGYYLDKDAVSRDNNGCTACPKDEYCPGFTDYAFDESDYGKSSCPPGYSADQKSKGETDCYKIRENVLCSTVNPYVVEHGVAAYARARTTCKEYYGNESLVPVDTEACIVTGVNCDSGYEAHEVDGNFKCVESAVVCQAGQYLPKNSRECAVCPNDSYCPGNDADNGFSIFATVDQGITECPGSLKSPIGASSEKDCGKVLHIDGEVVYLHKDKRGPSLVMDIKGTTWYADATPVADGKKKMSDDSNKELHIMIGNTEYTVHTSLCRENENCK